jgi:translation initiation factor 2 beta subunit (eIF-2beta)/eIF-5
MNLHVMKCVICDRPVNLCADENRILFVACKPCDMVTPLNEVVRNVEALSLGNPIGKEISTRHLFG